MATISSEIEIDMLNEIDIAPTIMRKIVAGPRIDDISITTWYTMYL